VNRRARRSGRSWNRHDQRRRILCGRQQYLIRIEGAPLERADSHGLTAVAQAQLARGNKDELTRGRALDLPNAVLGLAPTRDMQLCDGHVAEANGGDGVIAQR